MAVGKARVRLDRADPINRGLLGFWPLTDDAGSIVRDISPYGASTNTYSSGAVARLPSQPSRFGKTLKFTNGTPATKALVNNPSGLLASVQAPLSIVAWINPTATSGTQTIFAQYSFTTLSRLVKMLRMDGSTLAYYTSTAAGGYQAFNGPTVTAGVWQLVGVSIDAALNIRVYVGKSTTSGGLAALSATPDTSVAVQIGEAVAGFSEGFTGNISGVRVLSRPLQPAEWNRLLADPWAGTERHRASALYVAPTGYTLTAASGSFTVSGQSVNLRAARLLTAASGSLALSGQDVALKAARRILIDSGSLTLSGQNVTLTRARLPLVADAGTFTVTGQDVALKAGFLLSATTAFYTVTGRDATLTYSGEVAAPPSGGGARRARKGFRRIRLPVEEPAVAYQSSSIPPELKAQAKKAWQDDDDEWILLA